MVEWAAGFVAALVAEFAEAGHLAGTELQGLLAVVLLNAAHTELAEGMGYINQHGQDPGAVDIMVDGMEGGDRLSSAGINDDLRIKEDEGILNVCILNICVHRGRGGYGVSLHFSPSGY